MGVWCRAQTPGREPRQAAAGERRPVGALGGMDRPTRCPRAFVTPPASPITYFQHWPLIPVYGWFCSVAISFLLLVSVPVSGEEPALPSLSSYPDLGRPQSGAVCEPLCGTRLGLGWGQALWGAAKEGGLVGMDTEVCYGDSGGARFPTPDTPCPVQRPMRGAMGACVGQWGCAGAGTGHRLEP